ncbi:inhibin alpha chain [Austrofundulus limnaeus]|uniref:Inhibin alpha chain n=1 Tax=Austrofundulus limnaeus TaxID=52670 RepID=A0A2I4C844_AUSLI|nr:PREDICTED: inhibin alpha chain [Austrofundulus limnaeus]
MASGAILILGSLWIQSLAEACEVKELPRRAVLSWFRERVLEGLGLEEPPVVHRRTRVPRSSRTAWESRWTGPDRDSTQMILFPTSNSSCADSALGKRTSSCSTLYFQPSVTLRDATITSAHFWFFAGEGVNSSAPLLILSPKQQLLQAPAELSSDGWSTYRLDESLLASAAEGPFLFQICCRCLCHTDSPDKTPFLHLYIQLRAPVRSRREATVPWSPSAVNLLQRPSQERPQQDDCHREEIQISFEELNWDNWIVFPKVLTFYYCHGNCSAWDRMAALLGMIQCCAPVPGTMRSLRITTTSDGGNSFKYETLPNILAEECTCI